MLAEFALGGVMHDGISKGCSTRTSSCYFLKFCFILNYVLSLWKHFIEMFIYVSKTSRSLVNFIRL